MVTTDAAVDVTTGAAEVVKVVVVGATVQLKR